MALIPNFHRRRQRGFSLMELVVTAAALGLLALTLPRIFRTMQDSVMAANANITAQSHLRGASHIIKQLLVSAKRSTVVIDAAVGEPPYSRIQFSTGLKSVVFYQSGKDLVSIITANGTTQQSVLVNEKLSSLAFSYPDVNDDRMIQLTLAIHSDNRRTSSNALEYATQLVGLKNP